MWTTRGTSAYCSLQKERRELLQGKAARGGFGAAGQPRLGWLVVWFAICLGFYCLAFWPGTFLYCLIVILCDCHAAARWPTTPWLFVFNTFLYFLIAKIQYRDISCVSSCELRVSWRALLGSVLGQLTLGHNSSSRIFGFLTITAHSFYFFSNEICKNKLW